MARESTYYTKTVKPLVSVLTFDSKMINSQNNDIK